MPYKEPLEGLRGHLESAQQASHKQDLQNLHDETVRLLDVEDPQADASTREGGFRRQLEQAVERYEVSHPELTRAVRQVLEVLSANGL